MKWKRVNCMICWASWHLRVFPADNHQTPQMAPIKGVNASSILSAVHIIVFICKVYVWNGVELSPGRKCPFDYLSTKQLECRFLWAKNVNKYAASSKLVKSSPITISIMIIIMFITNKLCGIVHARQHVPQRMMCGIVRASYMFLRGWCVEKLPNVTSSKVTNRALLLSTNICVDKWKNWKNIYLIYFIYMYFGMYSTRKESNTL